MTRALRTLFATFALALASAQAQAPIDLKVALVIGNAGYQRALLNPVNDAKAMGETLRGLGFEVIEVRDGSKVQMAEAINKLQATLKGKQGVGMLYYAGHGLQIDARNFMVPVDARIARAGDVPAQTVDVAAVIDAFKTAGNRMSIVVLDACRDNPFGGITTGKGLAPLDAPSGTFLAYATAPGNVASDGEAASGNGLYTQYLLQELKKPQARIEDVFKRVRFAVRKASNGKQIPWESTSLEDDFQFNEGRVQAPVKPSTAQLRTSFEQEKLDWDRIKDSRNPDDFYAFVQRYPSGPIAEAAHARLNFLTKPDLTVQGAGADGKDQRYAVDKFRPGDVYENRVTTNGSEMTIVYRVMKVEADRIEVMLEYPSSKGAIPNSLQVFDGTGGLKQVGEFARYDPPQHFVPGGLLQIGARWTAAYLVTYGGGANQPPRTISMDGKIVAREALTLPAGKFHAFRMETGGKSFDSKGEQPVPKTTVWMAPELPVPVRTDTVIEMPGIPAIKSVLELMKVTRGT